MQKEAPAHNQAENKKFDVRRQQKIIKNNTHISFSLRKQEMQYKYCLCLHRYSQIQVLRTDQMFTDNTWYVKTDFTERNSIEVPSYHITIFNLSVRTLHVLII